MNTDNKPVVFDELNNLKNKAIDQVLLAFAIISLISASFLFFAILKNPRNIYILRIALDIAFWGVILFRQQLRLETKVIVLIFLNLAVLAAELGFVGALTPVKYRFISLPLIFAFVVKPKYAILCLVTFIISYYIFAWLYIFKTLVYYFNVQNYLTRANIWIVDSGTILFISIAFIIIGHRYSKSLFQYNIRIKEQNLELIEKENKYIKLFESSNDAILILKDYNVVDFNNKSLELFNCNEEFLIGRNPLELSPEYQPDGKLSVSKASEIYNLITKGNTTIFDWQYKRADGTSFDVSANINYVIINGETLSQIVIRDVTEKKIIERELELHRKNLEKLVKEKTEDLETVNEELKVLNEKLYEKNNIISNQNIELKTTLKNLQETQTQLIQSEKMASLGILTAGVAHEINNPLNFIIGAYEGLLRHYKSNTLMENYDQVGALIDALKTGVERSSAIIVGLNQFSRQSKSQNEDCDLHAIINNSLTMLYNQIKRYITVEKKFCDSDIVIKGNVGNLHQVFINILVNAIQAIESKGVITIETECEESNIIVIISDSGSGISPENLNKVTDPFFTTKQPGEGTGLGLSIAYNLIKEHKGKLEINSEPGRGTSVNIKFQKSI